MIIEAARENLKNILMVHYKGLNAQYFYPVIRVMHLDLGMPYSEVFKDFYTIFKQTNCTIQFLSKIKKTYLKKLRLI